MNKYQKMMGGLNLSKTFTQEMMKKIHTPSKRKRPILRTALIAACICLLSVTTALASSQHIPSRVSVINEETETDRSSYAIRAELDQKARASLSPKLQEDLNGNTDAQIYYDKEALESYLGFELVNSPGLESAGIVEDLAKDLSYNWNLVPELANDTSARYILTVPNPETLKISSHRVIHNTEIYLNAYIVVGEVQKESLIIDLIGEVFFPTKKIALDFQYDENGNFILDEDGHPVFSETHYESAEHKFTFQNYTMPNGCTATIVTATEIESDGARGFKEYMGYFIYDGVLYTVKPYAIYDPFQDFPMNDYDCLAVMYEVLDLFE